MSLAMGPSVILMAALLALASVLHGQEPKALKPADLSVSGIAVDDDSAVVRRHLGAPTSMDSTGWHYRDLDLSLAGGKVRILSIRGPSRPTQRGLRVGDAATRALSLYRPCFADSTIVQICYNPADFDERAVIVLVADGRVTTINIGRIIQP
jgi:hypothetical protein